MATGPGDHSLKLQLNIQEAIPGIVNKLKGEFGFLGSAIHLAADLLKDFNKALLGISAAIGLSAMVVLIKLVKLVFTLNENVAIMGQRFGMSRGQIKEFNAQLFEASKRAGIMVDQTAHMAKTLIEAGFKNRRKDLADLSATLYQFSAITGISAETGAEFAAQLDKMGYNVSKLLPYLANLRESLNLSTIEFESVVKLSQQAADYFYVMGNKANGSVEQLSKLSAVMIGLGGDADTVNDQLMSFLDPSKYNANWFIQQLGYGVGENLKTLMGGFGDATTKILELQKRAKDYMQHLSKESRYAMIQDPSMVKVLKFYEQMSGWSRQEIEDMGLKIDNQTEMNKLYQEMGDVLIPLQRQWQKLLSEAMPTIKDLVRYLGKFLEKLTELAGFINKHGGGKTVLFGLLGIGVAGILLSVVGGLAKIAVQGAITGMVIKTAVTSALIDAGVAGAGAGTAIVGGMTAASAAGTALLAVLSQVGIALVFIGGAIATVAIAQKAFDLAKKLKLNWNVQMSNILDPLNMGMSWMEARGARAVNKHILGSGGTDSTTNIKQIGDQVATNQADADRRKQELLQKISEDLEAALGHGSTQNNLMQGLIGVIKHESRTDREKRLNQSSDKSAAGLRSY